MPCLFGPSSPLTKGTTAAMNNGAAQYRANLKVHAGGIDGRLVQLRRQRCKCHGHPPLKLNLACNDGSNTGHYFVKAMISVAQTAYATK